MNKDEAIQIIRNNFPTGRHQLCEALETLIPELKESDDEEIRKTLKSFFDSEISDYGNVEWRNGIRYGEIVSWLEKQGEKIDVIENFDTEFEKQVSYLIASTINKEHEYNEDFVKWTANALLNYAKQELEKQGEQKPTDKVEPKFKVGDWITIDNPCQIISIDGNYIVQYCDDEKTHEISKKFCEFQFHLWTIQDAKAGDVLAFNDGHGNDCIELIKSITDKKIEFWFCLANGNRYEVFDGITPYTNFASREDATPATREQRDLLFSKMKEAGYEWDAEKKELKKMKQKTTKLPNGEDYGIDSLYHAARILEKTLGNVDGYQSDDGILEHKCAIEAVNRLYKQKPAWSEEDEFVLKDAITAVDLMLTSKFQESNPNLYKSFEVAKHWLKSLKERMKEG